MKLAEGITKHGFRKWYERELMQSHGHLALCFMCLVGVFAAFEALTRFRGLTDQLIDIAAIGACIAAGLWSLKRYLYLLHHAELVAHQADCPSCGEYGRLRLHGEEPAASLVHVSCKKCEHRWSISE